MAMTKEEQKEKKRQRDRLRCANMTEEQRDAKRERDKHSSRLRRANMTEEQKGAYRKQRSKDKMTDSQKKERRALHLRKAYGLTIDDYSRMRADQGGRCAICGNTKPEGGRELAVDHCHMTGKVRGILCSKCNTGLHVLEKDVQRFQRMIQYIEHHKEN